MSACCQYETDLTDEQWEVLSPLLPAPQWHPGGPGRPPCDRRRVINGILYVNKTGCQWRMLPKDFGPWETVYGYFRRWRRAGVWQRVMTELRQVERRCHGRLAEPSAGAIDSQSVKTATQSQDVGFDRHKKIKGRKRHRWVVERTFAWLLNYRRHRCDYETLTATSEAMIQISMIHLLLKRLA